MRRKQIPNNFYDKPLTIKVDSKELTNGIEKVNYSLFKIKMQQMLIGYSTFDEQELNDLYTAYREHEPKITCKEWIQFWFDECSLDSHLYELKFKYRLP